MSPAMAGPRHLVEGRWQVEAAYPQLRHNCVAPDIPLCTVRRKPAPVANESENIKDVEASCPTHLVEGRWQVAVALDALDVWQMLVALHQRVVVGLLVQLPVHQRALLLARLGLRQQGARQ